MNIDQILRNKVIKERTTYVTIFKSNFFERMDHDFQKILFEIIAKKNGRIKNNRGRLRSIKNQQLPLLITSSISFKIISERKEITIIISRGEKKENHRYVIAKILKYLLSDKVSKSRSIKNSIRSPTEFLINFTGPT